MKNILIILSLVATGWVGAQDFQEKLVIPLSSPDSQGKLEVSQVRGNINVKTYNGNEVIVEATATENDNDNCGKCKEKEKDKSNLPAGMKRIASSSIEFSASEKNNKINVETNSWKQPIHLDISVPEKFDLELSTVHGNIEISGINGSLEISGVNGRLTFNNIAGSIVCNTVNGDITATMEKVTSDEPMSFVTLNGDVDVTLPASVKATAKMKSDRGEIFTDFDMTVDKSKPEVKTQDSGNYKVSINSWVFGAINGGGPEYTFKNMNGDIIIRKE